MADSGTTIAAALKVDRGCFTMTAIAPLAHQSSTLYDVRLRGERLIAKEFRKPAELYDAPLREAYALSSLDALDVAPRLMGWVPAGALAAGQWPVVVYRRMEGEMWDRRAPTPADMAALATLWLTVHRPAPDGTPRARGLWQGAGQMIDRSVAIMERYGHWARSACPEARPAADLLARAAAKAQGVISTLRTAPHRALYTRTDPRFANIIRRPDGRLGMVDWEDCGISDPAEGIADLRTGPNQEDLLTADAWAAFRDPVMSALSAQDAGLAERVKGYELATSLLWLDWICEHILAQAKAGPVRDWMMNTLPGEVRARRYLARALAWPDGDLDAALAEVREMRFY
ncbi:MAG: aminoglycoside phosphotransferase family protein [Thermoflexales bacterium]|nr:aminoglycoside phosphotransferase family protein [Thermoflexales bacterium]